MPNTYAQRPANWSPNALNVPYVPYPTPTGATNRTAGQVLNPAPPQPMPPPGPLMNTSGWNPSMGMYNKIMQWSQARPVGGGEVDMSKAAPDAYRQMLNDRQATWNAQNRTNVGSVSWGGRTPVGSQTWKSTGPTPAYMTPGTAATSANAGVMVGNPAMGGGGAGGGGSFGGGGGGGGTGGGGSLASEFQQQQDRGNQANEARYQDALAGYQDRYSRNMQMLENRGEQERRDIDRSYDEEMGRRRQDLVGRGLGNSTVLNTAEQANQRERIGSQSRLNERLIDQTLNTDSRLSGDTLGFMERRNDVQPDYNQLINLARGVGSAGYGLQGGFGGGYGGGGADLSPTVDAWTTGGFGMGGVNPMMFMGGGGGGYAPRGAAATRGTGAYDAARGAYNARTYPLENNNNPNAFFGNPYAVEQFWRNRQTEPPLIMFNDTNAAGDPFSW